ncbi:IS66 family insertion sequence element accessory protein TnpB [Sorangium sp. So ce269]
MTPATIAVYLAVGPVDLRGAFDRLAAITRQVLCLDPASGALFLFLNKMRNRLKALWWDRNGYTIL